MQNNVFLLVNYPWIYYVTDNDFLDAAAYSNKTLRSLNNHWYAGGPLRERRYPCRPPNPWLRKWLQHPSYDEYWQSMVPFGQEFARINIPVLAITGYYDDGQVSALGFFRDLYAFNRHANGYLVIGPWDHFGSQHAVKDAVLRGYRIDQAAQISTPKLTFDWFDYVMRGAPKPSLVKDRINFEVMGANRWEHAPSLDRMSPSTNTFYLTNQHAAVPTTNYRRARRRSPDRLRVRRPCRSPEDDEQQRLVSRSDRSQASEPPSRLRFHHTVARPAVTLSG